MKNNMIEVITNNNWTVSMETEEGTKWYTIKGYAQAFDDASEYVIVRTSTNNPDGKHIWFVSSFGIDNHAKMFITGIPIIIMGYTIHEIVGKFNRMYTRSDMVTVSPIHKVSIPETLFTLYYNEDGEWDCKIFSDALSDLHSLISKLGWIIPAKSFGNSKYRVIGIASTETDESICLISDNSENDNRVSITPVFVASDGTYVKNYFPMIASSGGLSNAVTQLNRMIAKSGNETTYQITDVITKSGVKMTFNTFERI